jgi:hypothetical protein
MTKHLRRQVQALDRVLYLLEEQSFTALGSRDKAFGNFVERLYREVDQESKKLISPDF